jgi:hypothetical protein
MSGRKQPLNGKSGLTTSVAVSKSTSSLERKLSAIYGLYQRVDGGKASSRRRQHFVFNMMDWAEDLERLAALYKNPEKFDKKAAGEIVAGFLYHALPHLSAAGRLLLDFSPGDLFKEIEERVE